MSKLTKAQRREKRKKKEQKRNRERVHKHKNPKAWEAPKMKLFEMPKLLEDDLTWEQRLTFVRAVGDQARAEFEQKYPNIQRWLTDYDPVYVLSMCAYYFTSGLPPVSRTHSIT